MAMMMTVQGGYRQRHSRWQLVAAAWCHAMHNGDSRSKVAAVLAHPGGDQRRAKARRKPTGAAAGVGANRVGGKGVARVFLD
ncbi:hypothetical protein L1987_53166 [Smallanthus sonchifolius]|uniref:Uncharacterized protein n=1 Tax=Smallanthus sonchifolius TaxID=185202 RepID=A0ACB9EVS8_9ASTR|nr:hypothetical protein L1987_53166 [Smallanthus sonchifolius]